MGVLVCLMLAVAMVFPITFPPTRSWSCPTGIFQPVGVVLGKRAFVWGAFEAEVPALVCGTPMRVCFFPTLRFGTELLGQGNTYNAHQTTAAEGPMPWGGTSFVCPAPEGISLLAWQRLSKGTRCSGHSLSGALLLDLWCQDLRFGSIPPVAHRARGSTCNSRHHARTFIR